MARPAKSINTQNKHNTKKDLQNRKEIEYKLKGKNNSILPPDYFTDDQKYIFNYIVTELSESGILGNLDVFVLSQCSIAIDRLQSIEKAINQDSGLLANATYMGSQKKYTDQFFRCCNELSLSPQSRAKIGSINFNAQKQKDDPILQLLNNDKNDGD